MNFQIKPDGNSAKTNMDSPKKSKQLTDEEILIKKLLKKVNKNQKEKIADWFTQLAEEKTPEFLKNIISAKGKDGWNAIHYAVWSQNIEIISFFLTFQPNINSENIDGYTPLQIAILRNSIEIGKLIVESPQIELQKKTKKGTALHLAAKNNNYDFCKLILEHDQQSSEIQDNYGYLPSQLATEQQVLELFNSPTSQTENDVEDDLNIVNGFLFKISTIMKNENNRFLEVNPVTGTLIRYKHYHDYPFKPKEVIPLNNIKYLSILGKKGKFVYFQIILHNQKQIFCCNYEETAQKWIRAIEKAQKQHYSIENEQSASNLVRLQQKELKKVSIEDVLVAEDEKFVLESYENEPQQKEQENKAEMIYNSQKLGDQEIKLSHFDVLKEVGSGAFGRVYLVRYQMTNKVYAMKALYKKRLIQRDKLKYAVSEARIMQNVNSHFITQLYYAFQTIHYMYMIMDYCSGGDLLFHLIDKKKFTDNEAKFYIGELVLAIEDLHNANIIYRDLKPENILIDDDGHLKLADFGLSKEGVGSEDIAKSFCGSPAYLSPEMLEKKGTGRAADIYGIGAILYEMLVGIPPFFEDNLEKMYKNIKEANLRFPKNLNPDAKDAILQFMNKDPEKRMGVNNKAEIKKHKFFANIDFECLAKKQYKPPIIVQKEDFNGLKSKLDLKDKDYDSKQQKTNRVKNYTFVYQN